MTKEEWDKVQVCLTRLNSIVVLNVDGYKVTLMLERASVMKNHIVVYIDDKIKGNWLVEDCEERNRFFCKRTKNVYTISKLTQGKRVSKKKMMFLKERVNDPKNKIETYYPWWTNSNSLKKHLIKNNTNIELIECS